MADRANIVRYELYCIEKNSVTIPEPINYDDGIKDVIERDKESKAFEVKKANAIELYGVAYDYILALEAVYGIIPDLRLREYRKSDDRPDQKWKQVSNVGLDLGTSDFDFERKTVKIKSNKGGLIELIDARLDDEYDLYSNDTAEDLVLQDLKTTNLRLDSRRIFRRSRLFVDGVVETTATVSGGDRLNARAIPFKIDYKSDNNVNTVTGKDLNAGGNEYRQVEGFNSSNLFYLLSDRDRLVRLTGEVNTRMTHSRSGSFSLDLVIYRTENLTVKEVINLDNCNPNILGDTCSYTFSNYEINLKKDDSMAIATLSDTRDGIRYETFDTHLIVEEDSVYPVTYTEAIKPFDLISRLVTKVTGKDDVFVSDLFGEGGKYENILVAHGTQLRNMPRIINEGEDDERVVQASVSLKKVIEAFSILEPLTYGTKTVNNKEVFYLESEKETQRNFCAIKLGITTDKFRLTPVSKEVRKVIPKNYYSVITIGSETTGSEYGEVNNLYSICGNATWNTFNTKKSEYKITTDFRTGSVDAELTRQKQYFDNPDTDSDYDNDWFMFDCKLNAVEYELKKWQEYYSTKPTNVYDVESEYNFKFTPLELLKGHGWKINSGLYHYPTKSLKFTSSNCTSNLVTDNFQHDSAIRVDTLEKPSFVNKTINFNVQVNQEISEMLRGTTNGIDNKFGLVKFISEGYEQYGRLIKVDENKEGKFELIEAYI